MHNTEQVKTNILSIEGKKRCRKYFGQIINVRDIFIQM